MTSPSQEEQLCVCGHFKSNHIQKQYDDGLECILVCECVEFTPVQAVPNEPSDEQIEERLQSVKFFKPMPSVSPKRSSTKTSKPFTSKWGSTKANLKPSAIGDELERIFTAKLFKKRNYRNSYMKEMGTAYAFDFRREKYVTKYLNQALKEAEALIEEQTKLALEVAKKDVEFAIRWNQPLEKVLEKMNQRLEASIKERSSDETR